MGLGHKQSAIVQKAAGRISQRRWYWMDRANAMFGVETRGVASPAEAADIRLFPLRQR